MQFTVKADTAAIVLSMDDDGIVTTKPLVTKKENVFETQDVRIDPTGILADEKRVIGPTKQSVAGKFAHSGLYGFLRNDMVLLVHRDKVLVSGQSQWDEDDEEESSEDS